MEISDLRNRFRPKEEQKKQIPAPKQDLQIPGLDDFKINKEDLELPPEKKKKDLSKLSDEERRRTQEDKLKNRDWENPIHKIPTLPPIKKEPVKPPQHPHPY